MFFKADKMIKKLFTIWVNNFPPKTCKNLKDKHSKWRTDSLFRQTKQNLHGIDVICKCLSLQENLYQWIIAVLCLFSLKARKKIYSCCRRSRENIRLEMVRDYEVDQYCNWITSPWYRCPGGGFHSALWHSLPKLLQVWRNF